MYNIKQVIEVTATEELNSYLEKPELCELLATYRRGEGLVFFIAELRNPRSRLFPWEGEQAGV